MPTTCERAADRSALTSPLHADAEIAPVADMLADPARATMLWALSDGRALPAGELARVARMRPPAASAHLAKLLASGLVAAERHGRHRYFRLVEPGPVVAALEALAVVAPLRQAHAPPGGYAASAVRLARTCYDHLAGRLGVAITDALVEDGALVLSGRAYEVTKIGEERLGRLGIGVAEVADAARRGRRPLTRACLDWSERRYHLAGALGTALVTRLLELDWVDRMPSSRALRITAAGRRALHREFGVRLW